MKVLISSYNVVGQNASGGVQVRVFNYLKHISKLADVKLFDMWSDKLDDCDIIHVFKANIDSYSLMVQAKEKGKKIVLSSVIPQEKPLVVFYNLLLSKLFKMQTGYLIIQKELKMADAVIAQTEQEKSFIVKHFGISADKISVIPNGISVNFSEDCRDVIKQKYDIPQKYLLQVGRFDENKNQLSVIRALKETGIPIVFVGGPDPLSEEYYQRCKEEAESSVTFLGWLKNGSPELQSAYLNAHAVILPSKKEIFGNSLIEGGASGSLLIATDSLPIDSMGIGDYCFKVNPNDIKDIRNKVLTAWESEKKPNQVDFFHSTFSWETVANKHYQIYRDLLEND